MPAKKGGGHSAGADASPDGPGIWPSDVAPLRTVLKRAANNGELHSCWAAEAARSRDRASCCRAQLGTAL